MAAADQCRYITLAERRCYRPQHDYRGTHGCLFNSVVVSLHLAEGLCNSCQLCSGIVRSEEKTSVSLLEQQQQNLLQIASCEHYYTGMTMQSLILFSSAGYVSSCCSVHTFFFFFFLEQFCSEKLCGIWGIFMPYKCKIVLICFLKPHAGLTLDPTEVNGILPCFDGTRMGLIVSREKLLQLFKGYFKFKL